MTVSVLTRPTAQSVPASSARRRPSRRRKGQTGPALTVEGIAGLSAHLDRLRSEAGLLGELMSDPKRDERVVLDLERILDEIDRFDALLAQARVLDDAAATASETVVLGSRVQVRFDDGSSESVRVVHPAEAFLDDERISARAPLAAAALGLASGDRGVVAAPCGPLAFTVVRIG
jgi:transcription elongation GreA/GreB family factor